MKNKFLSSTIALMTAIILAFVFAACSDGNSSGRNAFSSVNPNSGVQNRYTQQSYSSLNQQTVTNIQENEEKPLKEIPTDITLTMPELGQFHIKSYALTKNEHIGMDIIVLKMDYTNLEDSDHSSSSLLGFLNLYQDDIKLDVHPEYFLETGTVIRPNKTIEISYSYRLRNTSSDVYIELANNSDVFGSATLSIK